MEKKVNKFTADAKHYFYVPMRQGTVGRGHKKIVVAKVKYDCCMPYLKLHLKEKGKYRQVECW
jgi:hypothetical protein